MDTKTILIAFIIQAIMYGITFYVLSLKRKPVAFLCFTASFILIALTDALTIVQELLPIFFSLIVINTFFFLFFILMVFGFLFYLDQKVKWVPLGVILTFGIVSIILLTYVFPHYSLRIIVSSLTTTALVITGYIQINTALRSTSRNHSIFMFLLILFYSLINVARIISAIVDYSSVGLLTENITFNNIIAFLLLLSINLWTLLILTLDQYVMQKDLRTKNDELSIMASTDSLTGLRNRHLLEQDIFRFTALADRFHTPLSFIIYDLDFFKTINDTYGHDYGDEVLIKVTKAVQAKLRDTDRAYRWGGEEFLIILPNTSLDDAKFMAENLRLSVKQFFEEETVKVTISLGVADYVASEPSNHWFRKADYALGQAKQTGRDKVVVWNSVESLPLAFAKIEWQDAWNSGHDIIDQQHREILDLANELAVIGIQRENESTVIRQLEIIFSQTLAHFRYEEEILKLIQFPGYEKHRMEHDFLIQRYEKLIDETKSHKLSVKECFDRIVGVLIMGHMLHYDRLYFSSLKKTE